MEHYSAIKHGWTLKTWGYVKESNTKIFPLYEMSKIDKPIETKGRLVVARGWGSEEKRRGTINGYRISFWGDGNALTVICSDGSTAQDYPEKPLNCSL